MIKLENIKSLNISHDRKFYHIYESDCPKFPSGAIITCLIMSSQRKLKLNVAKKYHCVLHTPYHCSRVETFSQNDIQDIPEIELIILVSVNIEDSNQESQKQLI